MNIGVMFSSPGMILLFIFGVFIGLVFLGAIVTVIVQLARGKFHVDYDEIAAKNAREYEQKRREKR